MLKVSILDGYIDEPTCLGVPPYISPYPRYLAGAVYSFDKKANVCYYTIDQIRNKKELIYDLNKSDLLIVIAGMAVPGKYLSGYPASPNEILSIINNCPNPFKMLSGPAARYGFGISGGHKTKEISSLNDSFDIIAKGDGEIIIYEFLKNKLSYDKIKTDLYRENAHSISDYAILGAKIVTQHPYFPSYLITEIETYRGCARTLVGGCSFCSEPSKGFPEFRHIDDIISEVKALYQNGIKHFRIGNQPCIFSYMSIDAGKKERPRPNPEAIKKLFKGIRQVAPNLKILHIDNANPGVIAEYPKESEKIAKTIVKYHTPGDVAALGVESADPDVIDKNNLKASPGEIFDAIRLINKVGAKRGSNGMSELLPGLNFVFGLIGESKKTFDLNYKFLKDILDKGLLLRRINLRQVIPIPGTKMYDTGIKLVNKHKADFKRFKKRVSEDIVRPMLKNLLPIGTILKDVYCEKADGKTIFGRQLGSYPLLIGIPGISDLNKFIDVKIVDYGFRSITAIPHPLYVNEASRETLEAVPGIGKKRAIRLLAGRPFKNKKHLLESFDEQDAGKKALKFIKINE